MLPTSVVGSLPKPAWLAEPAFLRSPWRWSGADLVDAQDDAVRLAIQDRRTPLPYVKAEHLHPCTDCGMVPRTRRAACGKTQAQAAGAAVVRAELSALRPELGADSLTGARAV